MTDILLYCGLAAAGASVATGAVTAAALWASRRRLDRDPLKEEGAADVGKKLHLRGKDPRFIRWRRARAVSGAILTVTFLLGVAAVYTGGRQADRRRLEEVERHEFIAEQGREKEEARRLEAENLRTDADSSRETEEARRADADELRAEAEQQRRIEEMRTLAAISAELLSSGNTQGALKFALESIPGASDAGIPFLPESQKAISDALFIYDLSDGYRPYLTVTLQSYITNLAIAPAGGSFAAASPGRLSVYETATGLPIAELAMSESGYAAVRYLDDRTVVYATPGGLTAYDLLSASAPWSGDGATSIAISADGSMIASVFRDETYAVVYSADGGNRTEVDFGENRQWVADSGRMDDPGGNILELNHDGTMLAVSFANGGLKIFNLANKRRDIEIYEESDYTFFEGGFSGGYFAYSATGPGESLFAVIDTRKAEPAISMPFTGKVGAFADEGGVYISYNGVHTAIDPVTAAQTQLGADPRGLAAGGFLVSGSKNSPVVQVWRYESCAGKGVLSYDPGYMHDEARVNSAGDRFMLFSSTGFRIYDADGDLINETELPDAGNVQAQQYRREGGGSYLAVAYGDGAVRRYSGDDGAQIAYERVQPPGPALYQEFIAGGLLIRSPMDRAPTVHDAQTGELMRELEGEGSLAYVTQAGDHIIAGFIAADGGRFGLLLEGVAGEIVAYIPGLCDYVDGRLIIDVRGAGSLREAHLLSAEELVGMAREALGWS